MLVADGFKMFLADAASACTRPDSPRKHCNVERLTSRDTGLFSRNLLVVVFGTGSILFQLVVQLHRCTFGFHAVGAERGGAGRGAERRAVLSGMENLQLSRYSGINRHGSEAAAMRPGLLFGDEEGTFEGGFKKLLQDCG